MSLKRIEMGGKVYEVPDRDYDIIASKIEAYEVGQKQTQPSMITDKVKHYVKNRTAEFYGEDKEESPKVELMTSSLEVKMCIEVGSTDWKPTKYRIVFPCGASITKVLGDIMTTRNWSAVMYDYDGCRFTYYFVDETPTLSYPPAPSPKVELSLEDAKDIVENGLVIDDTGLYDKFCDAITKAESKWWGATEIEQFRNSVPTNGPANSIQDQVNELRCTISELKHTISSMQTVIDSMKGK